jgi:DNA-directed RNA polymerase
MGSGPEVKGMPSRFDMPLPAKPADFETNKEARGAWKRKAAEIFRSNQRASSKRMLTAKIMYVAEKFEPSRRSTSRSNSTSAAGCTRCRST